MSSIRLTKADLTAIEHETMLLVGDAPTIATLEDEGLRENTSLIKALDIIADGGRIITLTIAQAVQSVGAVLIAIVAGILEFERVKHGAVALGQSAEGAVLIGVFVVSANFILPIYALRAMAGKSQMVSYRQTLRGVAESLWSWIWGKPSSNVNESYHNARLHMAGMVLTWTTILLALYDVLSPLITQLATGIATRPTVLLISEFVAGVGLSVGGVYFLQSASHEIGVSTITNQPHRLSDEIVTRRVAWEQHRDEIRNEVRERYTTAKANEVKPKNVPLEERTDIGNIPHALGKDNPANGRMIENVSLLGGTPINYVMKPKEE